MSSILSARRNNTYSVENIELMKRLLIATIVLSVCVSGILLAGTIRTLRELRMTKQSLINGRAELSEIKVQMLKENEHNYTQWSKTGVLDSFAVTMSGWAKAGSINLTTLAPEGDPVSTDIEMSGEKLGTWNASRIKVKGTAPYSNVMAFLEDFRSVNAPVRLESFSIDSVDTGCGEVSFELVVTVYEKQVAKSS